MIAHKYTAKVSFTLVFILLAALLLGPIKTVEANYIAPQFSQVTSSTGTKGAIHTDGKTVVWSSFNSGNPDIYAVNLTDRKELPIAIGSSSQVNPDVSGQYVVWQQQNTVGSDFEIHAKNLDNGIDTIVGNGIEPAISSPWVVWTSSNGLIARNIVTMAPEIPLNVQPSESYLKVIEGTRIVWVDRAIGGSAPRGWSLKTIQIGEAKPTIVDSGNSTKDLGTFDLNNGTLAYSVGNDLKVNNFKTGENKTVRANFQYYFSNISTDGRFITWINHQFSPPRQDVVLPGFQVYDLLTNSTFTFSLTTSGGQDRDIRVRNNTLVLVENSQIFTAPISATLPTTRQPQVSNTSNTFYFNDTGHTLSNGFKGYWERNGGLTVFGFPQTEEFDELNPDTGKVYTVQYFERQRYEYHPENQGTPYETLLGRVGVADAQRRNIINTTPFQRIAAANDANCIYFPETGHKACDNFLTYWKSHGLDLNDVGISFRESLALFGFPISEVFKDPDSGYMVQYFERARFEYHAENKGTPFEILLGLLGNNELKGKNWP